MSPKQRIIDPNEGESFTTHDGTELLIAAGGAGTVLFQISAPDTTTLMTQFPGEYVGAIFERATAHTGKTPKGLINVYHQVSPEKEDDTEPATRTERRRRARQKNTTDPAPTMGENQPIPTAPSTFTDPDGDTLTVHSTDGGKLIHFTITTTDGREHTAQFHQVMLIPMFVAAGNQSGFTPNDLGAAARGKGLLVARPGVGNRAEKRRRRAAPVADARVPGGSLTQLLRTSGY